MDRQNPRSNSKSKAIQTKSHKESYTYTLIKREKGKKKYPYILKKKEESNQINKHLPRIISSKYQTKINIKPETN